MRQKLRQGGDGYALAHSRFPPHQGRCSPVGPFRAPALDRCAAPPLHDGVTAVGTDEPGVDGPPKPPAGAGDQLRSLLWAMLKALEVGHWRAVLQPPEFRGRPVAGPPHLVRWAVALRLVAVSMQLQAQGRLQDAWDRLSEAAGLLPSELVRLEASTNTVFAVLRPEPPDGVRPDVELVVGLARLIWRDQHELRHLKRRFAPGRMRAHDELVEAIVQHLFWVEFDPATYCRRPPGEPCWGDGVTVDRSRKVLRLRATEIRWFGNPGATVEVSQAPWQDGGAFLGLYADALDLLAGQAEPAPWCGVPGTSGLVVRRGRLRAWQYAHQRKEDLDSLRVLTLV